MKRSACRVCGRGLKNPKWVELGIGPVCARKHGVGAGRTFFVSPNGNNKGGLSWKTAYRSLEDLDAAQVLADGCVVCMA